VANFAGDLTPHIISATLYGNTTGVTTSANLQGASVDLADNVGNVITAVAVVGVVTGTSPTMDAKMQESTDGTTWTDVTSGAFTQITTSSQVQALAIKPTKRYVRCTGTVGGTSPVFPTQVVVYAARRHVPTSFGGFNNTAAGV
jgi:hypothetical protein